MKQLFQNLKTGQTELVECPYPQCKKGSLIIQSKATLISLGTERMLVEFSKSGPLEKAKQQPEKVKQVFDKIKTEGLLPTVQAVMNKLDEPLPLGYCNAGVVLEVGEGVSGYSIGDHVVSNGAHAEVVSVPKNLVTRIPDGVSFEEAAFTVAGSIGLQGVRLAAPTLGETAVVIGLGLIGQLTAQIVKAHGCRVIALDLDPSKVKLATAFGIEALMTSDPVESVMQLTNGIGADSVIITASSASEAIISQSAKMSRKRGRIVLVGVIPLSINRTDFYEKELSFQVSCSYGPGRYDPGYEQGGNDYPLPFVRWTEQRNFDAVLHCIKSGSLNVKPLISERVPFTDTPLVYDRLGETKSIATIITYSEEHITPKKTIQISTSVSPGASNGIAIIGAGNFTKMTLLPALKKTGATVHYLCNQSGASGPHIAKKFGIPICTTETDKVIDDEKVKSVIITTRHRSHSALCLKILDKGKHVFVEKPLAINREQLNDIKTFFGNKENGLPTLTVGFNRRYSPLIRLVKDVLGVPSLPLNMIYTMNAGAVPQNHWILTAEEGGRIVGEACHCIDLFVYLAASPVVSVCATSLGEDANLLSDNVSILLKCKSGSQAVINYYSNGSKQYPKEEIKVFSKGTVMVIDNFKALKIYGKKSGSKKLFSADKGHLQQFKTYIDFLNGKCTLPNSLQEHINVTEASIAAVESLLRKSWVDLELSV